MLGDALAAVVFRPLRDECFDVVVESLSRDVDAFAAWLIVVGKKAAVHIVVVVVLVLLMLNEDFHQPLRLPLRIVAGADVGGIVVVELLLPSMLIGIHFDDGSLLAVPLLTYSLHCQPIVLAMDCMDDGYCHHLDPDVVLFVNRAVAAAVTSTT